MSRWVSIPLLLGGGWIVATMLGISIHPSINEAVIACRKNENERIQAVTRKKIPPAFYWCAEPNGSQVLLMKNTGGLLANQNFSVEKRYFYL
jgi:hypothetical protein